MNTDDMLSGEGGTRGVRAGEDYAAQQVFDPEHSWVEPGVGRWWGFGPFGTAGPGPA